MAALTINMESEPLPTEDEIMTCYKVLELIRDHHDETGLVHKVNTLNEAHSLVQEFELEYVNE